MIHEKMFFLFYYVKMENKEIHNEQRKKLKFNQHINGLSSFSLE